MSKVKEWCIITIIVLFLSCIPIIIVASAYYESCSSFNDTGKIAQHKLGTKMLIYCECVNGKFVVRDEYRNEYRWFRNDFVIIEE